MTVVPSIEQAPRRSAAAALLKLLAGPIAHGAVVIELPNGRNVTIGDATTGRIARLSVRSWRLIARLAAAWDIGLAESYMAGEWMTSDLALLLSILCRNENPAGASRVPEIFAPLARLRHGLNRNTHAGSKRNIAAHYDLGNDFYAYWLDRGMNYSSALYSGSALSLEDAQRNKLGRVTELLEIAPGQSMLEIGCGWGTLARHLAQEHGSKVTALTLSREQRMHAQAENGAANCQFLLQDYRDVAGCFDRIVSIEMLEAVGEAYWPRYFATLRDRLKPGGIAVVQAITIAQERFENYRRRPDFVQRYIFPGGMLPTSAIIFREAERAGLRLVHTEHFGASYARTLAEWAARFRHAWPKIEALGFDQRFKRMWEYYFAYCRAGFEAGAIDVGLYKLVHVE